MQTQIQFIEVERMSRPQARQKTDTVMTVMSEMLMMEEKTYWFIRETTATPSYC